MNSSANFAAGARISYNAFQWLLKSGIQDASQDLSYSGGVNAWFDLKDQSYPFVCSEITGYAINAFLFYQTLSDRPECLCAAQKAADWLLRNTYPQCNLVRTRLNHSAFSQSYFPFWVFTFDQWIIVYSLACLAEVSRENYYLEKAEEIATFLLERTIRKDGSFYPIFDVLSRTVEEPGDKWSRQAGSFHAKVLLALKKLENLTGKSEYKALALKILSRTLEIQETDGRFITHSKDGSTHLHPHLYTLEGLLSFGLAEGNQAAVVAAEKGVKWVLNHQLSNGAIYAFYIQHRFLPYVRVDILAQTLRLGLLLANLGFMNHYEKSLECLYHKLISYQITSHSQEGGFLYGQGEDGTELHHVNAWATMFAMQAIAILEHFWPCTERRWDMSFFV